jgi:DNA-binding FrmR family transcriptional regulator
MLTTNQLDATACANLTTRLKSIEGQARGIQRMLEDGRECTEILDQLAALRAASHAATMQALESFALHCMRESSESPEAMMTQMLSVVSRLTR